MTVVGENDFAGVRVDIDTEISGTRIEGSVVITPSEGLVRVLAEAMVDALGERLEDERDELWSRIKRRLGIG